MNATTSVVLDDNPPLALSTIQPLNHRTDRGPAGGAPRLSCSPGTSHSSRQRRRPGRSWRPRARLDGELLDGATVDSPAVRLNVHALLAPFAASSTAVGLRRASVTASRFSCLAHGSSKLDCGVANDAWRAPEDGTVRPALRSSRGGRRAIRAAQHTALGRRGRAAAAAVA
jgi:hypothetical protein